MKEQSRTLRNGKKKSLKLKCKVRIEHQINSCSKQRSKLSESTAEITQNEAQRDTEIENMKEVRGGERK